MFSRSMHLRQPSRLGDTLRDLNGTRYVDVGVKYTFVREAVRESILNTDDRLTILVNNHPWQITADNEANANANSTNVVFRAIQSWHDTDSVFNAQQYASMVGLHDIPDGRSLVLLKDNNAVATLTPQNTALALPSFDKCVLLIAPTISEYKHC